VASHKVEEFESWHPIKSKKTFLFLAHQHPWPWIGHSAWPACQAWPSCSASCPAGYSCPIRDSISLLSMPSRSMGASVAWTMWGFYGLSKLTVCACPSDTSMLAPMLHLWGTISGIYLPVTDSHAFPLLDVNNLFRLSIQPHQRGSKETGGPKLIGCVLQQPAGIGCGASTRCAADARSAYSLLTDAHFLVHANS
jgi:hypothetical protein